MTGGAGNDAFIYMSITDSIAGSADTITDFVRGEDKINLLNVDANAVLTGDQAFTFLTNPAGYEGDWTGMLWATVLDGVTTVYASNDADGEAEMQIVLSSAHQLTASDFIL
jgi:hypothetical protein